MARRHGFWFSVGQILGEVSALSESARAVADPGERPSDRRPGRAARARDTPRGRDVRPRTSLTPPEGARAPVPPGPPLDEGRDSLEWFLTRTASSMLTDRAERWLWKRRPAVTRLLWAAAAGAGAAAVATLAGRILEPPPSEERGVRTGDLQSLDEPADLVEEMLAGAGRGLVYATAVEPLLPGPPVFRGALYGTAEYLAGPWGGMTHHLSALAPQRRIPVLRQLLEPGRPRVGSAAECITEGVLLGALYGTSGPERTSDRESEG